MAGLPEFGFAVIPHSWLFPHEKILLEVSERGTITLPKSLRAANLYEVRSCEGGRLELIPQHAIDATQAWFWSDRWEAMEHEATADIEQGRVRDFESADELIAEIEKH